jgi:hypothetical protein
MFESEHTAARQPTRRRGSLLSPLLQRATIIASHSGGTSRTPDVGPRTGHVCTGRLLRKGSFKRQLQQRYAANHADDDAEFVRSPLYETDEEGSARGSSSIMADADRE